MNADDLTAPQPAPTGAGTEVWPAMIAVAQESAPHLVPHMLARHNFGVRKYGAGLRTHNGRDALADALQEVLDGIAYTGQFVLEAGQSNEVLKFVANANARLGAVATTLLSAIAARDAEAVMASPAPICDVVAAVSSKMMDARRIMLDSFVAAWCASTGVPPSEAALVHDHMPGGGYQIRVERRRTIDAFEHSAGIAAAVGAANNARDAYVAHIATRPPAPCLDGCTGLPKVSGDAGTDACHRCGLPAPDTWIAFDAWRRERRRLHRVHRDTEKALRALVGLKDG